MDERVKELAELIYMNRDYFIGKIVRVRDRKEVSLEEYARAIAEKIYNFSNKETLK